MRAIRLSEFGPPLQVLALEEVPTPEPGPGEVRVRMTHRPVNPSDLLSVMGLYPTRPALPGSPGLEGVGRVDAVGDGVTTVPVGQRVVTLAGLPGTWAEYVIVRADRVAAVPDAVSDQAAAQLLVNPVTAWALLYDELPLAEGDWVLQTAAGSALGQIVIQLARRRGLRTINVVRRRVQAQELLDLGADAVISTDDEPLVERVMALTGRRGVKAAIEAVGGPLGAQVASCLAPGGTMVVMGLLGADPVLPLNSAELLFKGTTVRGFWLTNWFTRRPPDVVARAIGEVIGLLAAHELNPPVEAEYDLADFQLAIEHAERPGRRGKVLLRG